MTVIVLTLLASWFSRATAIRIARHSDRAHRTGMAIAATAWVVGLAVWTAVVLTTLS